MRHVKLAACLLMVLGIASCQNSMSTDEINEKARSGVVLIMNYYYYSVTLPSGEELFFSDINDGELVGLTDDENEAAANCNGCTGTGFFISDDGVIMTNRHVARPEISEAQVKTFLKGLKKVMKQHYGKAMDEVRQKYYENEGNPIMQQRCVQAYKSYEKARDAMDDMDMNDADVTTHTSIAIVYNGSHITSGDDLNACSTIAVSEEESVDLALIQLDDETTPDDAYVFQLRQDDKELSMDDKLFMIGYNRGFSVSRTSEGAIESQIYTGNITQKGDGDKILYSIPSQPGSSGSPVLDDQCNVVAVHFAGYQGTQGFNYGIPLKKVRQFLKDN